MKKQILSKAGDWSQWTPELREALAASQDNYQVGEHLVYENDEFKIWSIHLLAGQSFPFHKHYKPYYWTALSAGSCRIHYNSGAIVDTEYESGDTQYFKNLSKEDYFIHNLKNTGKTTLIFSTVEFLD